MACHAVFLQHKSEALFKFAIWDIVMAVFVTV